MKEEGVTSPKNGQFEFQDWPVYGRALEFVGQAYELCDQLPKDSLTGLRDQLRRAAQSIPLNIAEGSSRYTGRDKANFFRIARGSVFECAAILDVVRKTTSTAVEREEMFKTLETIGRMLSGLITCIRGSAYAESSEEDPRCCEYGEMRRTESFTRWVKPSSPSALESSFQMPF